MEIRFPTGDFLNSQMKWKYQITDSKYSESLELFDFDLLPSLFLPLINLYFPKFGFKTSSTQIFRREREASLKPVSQTLVWGVRAAPPRQGRQSSSYFCTLIYYGKQHISPWSQRWCLISAVCLRERLHLSTTSSSLVSLISPSLLPSSSSLCLPPLLSSSSPLLWMDRQLSLIFSHRQRGTISAFIWKTTFQTGLIALHCCIIIT